MGVETWMSRSKAEAVFARPFASTGERYTSHGLFTRRNRKNEFSYSPAARKIESQQYYVPLPQWWATGTSDRGQQHADTNFDKRDDDNFKRGRAYREEMLRRAAEAEAQKIINRGATKIAITNKKDK
jgi:hypothetical protein